MHHPVRSHSPDAPSGDRDHPEEQGHSMIYLTDALALPDDLAYRMPRPSGERIWLAYRLPVSEITTVMVYVPLCNYKFFHRSLLAAADKYNILD